MLLIFTAMQMTPSHIYPSSQNQFQACLKDIKLWMTCSVLLFNPHETEITVIGPTHSRNKLLNDIVTLDHITLTSNSTVINLGFV